MTTINLTDFNDRLGRLCVEHLIDEPHPVGSLADLVDFAFHLLRADEIQRKQVVEAQKDRDNTEKDRDVIMQTAQKRIEELEAHAALLESENYKLMNALHQAVCDSTEHDVIKPAINAMAASQYGPNFLNTHPFE